MKNSLKHPWDLVVRRQLPVTPARAFAAWTDPDELLEWWGPEGVRCVSAEVDLRVGGTYRIGNELPDKRVLWIEGTFERVEPPNCLQYTWTTSRDGDATEFVEVRFVGNDLGTEIVICHRRVSSETLAEEHRIGWIGCLDGLASHLAGH